MNSSSTLYRDFMVKVWRPARFLLVTVAVAGVPGQSDAGRKRTQAQQTQSDLIFSRDQDLNVHNKSESKREFKEQYNKVNKAITQLKKNNNNNNLDFEALQQAAEQADLAQMQAVDRFNDAARLHGEKNTVVTLQAVNQAIQDVMTANQNKTAAESNLLNVGNASQQDINIIRQARQRMQQIRLELGFKVDDHLWNNLAPPGLNQQAQQQAAQQATQQAQQQAAQQAQQQAAQQAQQQAAQQAQQQAAQQAQQQAAQQAQQQAAQQALLIHQGPQQFAAQLALQAQQQVQAQNAAANNNNNNSVYASFSQALADQYEGVGAPLD